MKSVNHRPLIEVGMATRFGPGWPGCRCGAKTHKGTPCQKAALKGKTGCRLHGRTEHRTTDPGGQGTGHGAHTKHGRRSKDHVARVKAINAELRRITYELKRGGWIP